ncbi:hypothetical protein BDZ91DRAFT_545837 [Kalaharituber pfeilii]|nr:hypothetical protein BDZ91DRAFT_545837 [Kalaharituber pfeilii]
MLILSRIELLKLYKDMYYVDISNFWICTMSSESERGLEFQNRLQRAKTTRYYLNIMKEEAATYTARAKQLQTKEEERHITLLEEQEKPTKQLENLCECIEQKKVVQDNLQLSRSGRRVVLYD